jgi:hypothetical protein
MIKPTEKEFRDIMVHAMAHSWKQEPRQILFVGLKQGNEDRIKCNQTDIDVPFYMILEKPQLLEAVGRLLAQEHVELVAAVLVFTLFLPVPKSKEEEFVITTGLFRSIVPKFQEKQTRECLGALGLSSGGEFAEFWQNPISRDSQGQISLSDQWGETTGGDKSRSILQPVFDGFVTVRN